MANLKIKPHCRTFGPGQRWQENLYPIYLLQHFRLLLRSKWESIYFKFLRNRRRSVFCCWDSRLCFVQVSFSALIATVCDTELTFDRLSIAYSVPAFVMSGYTWPQDAMDEVGQVLSCLFPLSYFSNTLRELMLAGYSASLYRNSATLVLIGTVSFYFTTIVFGKKCKNMKSCHMPISKQGDFDIIGNR